ncbi:hypothetical protein C8F04DRAFT_1190215 [Mycena alexandri]|uniref:Uncharacterized protein n=1 Tax=Mycena alexandri TaxID=1745969 RepID=A0AAD6SF82_9AGAR|nr:hypothetical protein C8F04DRAFT_1190215 [Mycena alexandri]
MTPSAIAIRIVKMTGGYNRIVSRITLEIWQLALNQRWKGHRAPALSRCSLVPVRELSVLQAASSPGSCLWSNHSAEDSVLHMCFTDLELCEVPQEEIRTTWSGEEVQRGGEILMPFLRIR